MTSLDEEFKISGNNTINIDKVEQTNKFHSSVNGKEKNLRRGKTIQCTTTANVPRVPVRSVKRTKSKLFHKPLPPTPVDLDKQQQHKEGDVIRISCAPVRKPEVIRKMT